MEFVDRVVEHPNRYTLTKVSDNTSEVYDLVRNEGTETVPGTKLTAEILSVAIEEAVAAAINGLTIDSNHNVSVRNIQSGSATVAIKTANVTVSKAVKFAREFTAVPNVVVTPHTNVPQKMDIGVADIKTTGFTITINRTTATDTPVSWIALL